MLRSSDKREAKRARWRAFVLPHWPRLERDVLTSHEAKILGLRLGVVSDVGLTQRAIARRLHVTETTVATTEKRALAKVTAALRLQEDR